jgi:dihydroneopterin aldolase
MTQPGVVQPFQSARPVSFRRVFVRDLIVYSVIGVHRHERNAPQRVRINIDLTVAEERRPINDQLANVVCYEEVVNRIREIAESGHINLVETLAEYIAASCLEDSRVHRVVVRVEKPDVFEDAASVGIEIDRSRARN